VTSDDDASAVDPAAPRLRVLTGALVAVEALVLVGLAVFLVVETFVATAAEPGGAVALAALALVAGAGLGACAYGLVRGQGWTRAPVVTWQVLQAGVALPSLRTDTWPIGIPLLAAAVTVLVLVLAGRATTTPTS
jgi:hypothetical protein